MSKKKGSVRPENSEASREEKSVPPVRRDCRKDVKKTSMVRRKY